MMEQGPDLPDRPVEPPAGEGGGDPADPQPPTTDGHPPAAQPPPDTEVSDQDACSGGERVRALRVVLEGVGLRDTVYEECRQARAVAADPSTGPSSPEGPLSADEAHMRHESPPQTPSLVKGARLADEGVRGAGGEAWHESWSSLCGLVDLVVRCRYHMDTLPLGRLLCHAAFGDALVRPSTFESLSQLLEEFLHCLEGFKQFTKDFESRDPPHTAPAVQQTPPDRALVPQHVSWVQAVLGAGRLSVRHKVQLLCTGTLGGPQLSERFWKEMTRILYTNRAETAAREDGGDSRETTQRAVRGLEHSMTGLQVTDTPTAALPLKGEHSPHDHHRSGSLQREAAEVSDDSDDDIICSSLVHEVASAAVWHLQTAHLEQMRQGACSTDPYQDNRRRRVLDRVSDMISFWTEQLQGVNRVTLRDAMYDCQSSRPAREDGSSELGASLGVSGDLRDGDDGGIVRESVLGDEQRGIVCSEKVSERWSEYVQGGKAESSPAIRSEPQNVDLAESDHSVFQSGFGKGQTSVNETLANTEQAGQSEHVTSVGLHSRSSKIVHLLHIPNDLEKKMLDVLGQSSSRGTENPSFLEGPDLGLDQSTGISQREKNEEGIQVSDESVKSASPISPHHAKLSGRWSPVEMNQEMYRQIRAVEQRLAAAARQPGNKDVPHHLMAGDDVLAHNRHRVSEALPRHQGPAADAHGLRNSARRSIMAEDLETKVLKMKITDAVEERDLKDPEGESMADQLEASERLPQQQGVQVKDVKENEDIEKLKTDFQPFLKQQAEELEDVLKQCDLELCLEDFMAEETDALSDELLVEVGKEDLETDLGSNMQTEGREQGRGQNPDTEDVERGVEEEGWGKGVEETGERGKDHGVEALDMDWSYDRLVRVVLHLRDWLSPELVLELFTLTLNFDNIGKSIPPCFCHLGANALRGGSTACIQVESKEAGTEDRRSQEKTRWLEKVGWQLLTYMKLAQACNSPRHHWPPASPHSHPQSPPSPGLKADSEENVSPQSTDEHPDRSDEDRSGSDGEGRPGRTGSGGVLEAPWGSVRQLLTEAVTLSFNPTVDRTVDGEFLEKRAKRIERLLSIALDKAGHSPHHPAAELTTVVDMAGHSLHRPAAELNTVLDKAGHSPHHPAAELTTALDKAGNSPHRPAAELTTAHSPHTCSQVKMPDISPGSGTTGEGDDKGTPDSPETPVKTGPSLHAQRWSSSSETDDSSSSSDQTASECLSPELTSDQPTSECLSATLSDQPTWECLSAKLTSDQPPSESLSAKLSDQPPSESFSAKLTSDQPPSESFSAKLTSDQPPSESLSAKPSDQPSSESVSAKPSDQPPSGSLSAKPCDQPPSESLSAKPSDQPPSGSLSAKPSDQPPSEGLSAKLTSDQPPSESLSAKPSDQPPSKSLSAKPCDQPPSGSLSVELTKPVEKRDATQRDQRQGEQNPTEPDDLVILKQNFPGPKTQKKRIESSSTDDEESPPLSHKSQVLVLDDEFLTPEEDAPLSSTTAVKSTRSFSVKDILSENENEEWSSFVPTIDKRELALPEVVTLENAELPGSWVEGLAAHPPLLKTAKTVSPKDQVSFREGHDEAVSSVPSSEITGGGGSMTPNDVTTAATTRGRKTAGERPSVRDDVTSPSAGRAGEEEMTSHELSSSMWEDGTTDEYSMKDDDDVTSEGSPAHKTGSEVKARSVADTLLRRPFALILPELYALALTWPDLDLRGVGSLPAPAFRSMLTQVLSDFGHLRASLLVEVVCACVPLADTGCSEGDQEKIGDVLVRYCQAASDVAPGTSQAREGLNRSEAAQPVRQESQDSPPAPHETLPASSSETLPAPHEILPASSSETLPAPHEILPTSPETLPDASAGEVRASRDQVPAPRGVSSAASARGSSPPAARVPERLEQSFGCCCALLNAEQDNFTMRQP
ncbi:hypothetical protein ACOMHN_000002 [Nucella lapillus]